MYYKHFVWLILWVFAIKSLSHAQKTPEILFSVERGYCKDPFQLSLRASSEDAIIRYTRDGTIPTDSSQKYLKPINIDQTTVIRALVFLPTGETSTLHTHTYLFVEEVLSQPDSIPGWPNDQLFTYFTGKPVRYDSEMDPEIIGVSRYRKAILNSFQQLPSIMISMPVKEFWGMYYSDEELPAFLEILYPEGEHENEAAFAGIEGISHKIIKRSYRLSFKKKYGDGKLHTNLFRDFAPFHAETAEDDLDQLVLRGGTQRCWARNWYPDQTAYTRDQWYRDTQLEMSGYGARGTFGHVFVNGVYIGLYNLTERPDENFFASYFEGKDDEWFVINHNGVLEGNDNKWEYLLDTLIHKDLNDPGVYSEFTELVDVESYIDYLLASWICGMEDWPVNNYYGGYNQEDNIPLKFVGWDAEVSWDDQGGANPGAWIHREFRRFGEPESEISEIWHAARESKRFMMNFADRVYQHCFEGGALTDSAQRYRWKHINEFIADGIVAESARWGDALEDGITRTRDEHWKREVARVDSMMQGNTKRFLAFLRHEEYYPRVNPPLIEALSIESSSGIALELKNPNEGGEIYFRVDGGDPWLPDGKVAPEARLYQQPFTIKVRSYLMARVKMGDQWSALGKY